jgi:hypothetical protein
MQRRLPETFGHSSAIPSGNEPAVADVRPSDKIPQPKVRDATKHDRGFQNSSGSAGKMWP